MPKIAAKKSPRKTKPVSHYHILKKQWLKRHDLAKKNLHKKHAKALKWVAKKLPGNVQIASGAVGALMLSSVLPTTSAIGSVSAISTQAQPQQAPTPTPKTAPKPLIQLLKESVPEEVRPLTAEEETEIGQFLSEKFKMKIAAELEGKRLNRSYGLIGAEQHLARFPGDSMATHLGEDNSTYNSGMAPGKGAWGYFVQEGKISQKEIDREKWYIAVQTFEAPDYNQRIAEYREFFKYRKMLVVNTLTGQAVVTDIADAGPAVFTGKHLGGSPEVMQSLGLYGGPMKGPVLYFFIDDPDDTIALGPVNIK